LAIPCKGNESSEYAMTWLASADDSRRLWHVYCDGSVFGNGSSAFGFRPVVSLKSKVKFTPAENNINDTPTWNIAM
jgi:hypothetical protein